MIWAVLAALVAGVAAGEVHGRRVAYRRRERVLAGLVGLLESSLGRWAARRRAEREFIRAQVPARVAVLGPEVTLEEIEETDADRAFLPDRGCCEDCDDALDAIAAEGPAS